MNLKKYRDGQELAHSTITTRIRAARDISAMTREELEASIQSRYTAIVLPTRYGKSDVIRCSAIELYRSEDISAALVLSPNRLLRDQMVKPQYVDDMVKRYQIMGAGGLRYRAIERGAAALIDLTANREFLLSATMQLLDEHVSFFEQWVEHMLYRHHAPVVIYIDEAHTGSDQNVWGQAVHRLVRQGACAVLLTATPMRADGRRIPGFDFEELDHDAHAKQYKSRPSDDPNKIIVDVWEGCRTLLRLKAHHTTTFRQAWNERPATLCRISRLPFDVAVTNGQRKCQLSELNASDTRRVIGQTLRTREVARRGANTLVQELHAMRRLQADCGAIVFVSNDEAAGREVNRDARVVERLISDQDASLDVVIATAADGDEGIEKIEKFANGRGDVLIVKQMASLGLSVPRLKIALDLSPIRTPAAYIQRIMRIATPYHALEVGVLITPDDCLQRALFEALINAEGGEARATDLYFVRSYEKDREESQPDLFTIEGVIDADFDDSHGIRAEATLRPDVDAVVSAFPQLLSLMSHAQIALQMVDSGITIGQRIERPIDTGQMADDLRNEINELVGRIVMLTLQGQYDRDRYASLIRQVHTEAKVSVGVSSVVELQSIVDVLVLRRIRDGVLQRIRERES